MLHEQVLDPLFPGCPVRNVLSRISGKWPILVLLTLSGKGRALRFKEIQADIPDISQRMLTVTLRDLEADGMLTRIAYAEVPPRVEYTLTPRGASIMPHIQSLVNWAVDNMNDIIADRKARME